MIETIKELEKNLKELPGYVAASLTDIESGETLFSSTEDSGFDIELASALNLEVVKAKLRAIDALELTETIDSITINLDTQIHIIDITKSKNNFIYLALDTSKTTIGLVKGLLNKYKKALDAEF